MSYGVASLYPSLNGAKYADKQFLKPVWFYGKIASCAYVAMLAETFRLLRRPGTRKAT